MRYTNPDCVQFVEDMEAAGLEVHHYHGRFYYEGPSVHVDDLQEALSNTRVPCQYESLGLGWVVYTKARDKGVPDEESTDHGDAGPAVHDR
jgi:hypothetical protein